MAEAKKTIRTFRGIVVSDKMDKTAVVEVVSIKSHKKYNKRYKSTSRFKVHDAKNECKVGDMVIFRACRPLSKEKRWLYVNKINKK